MWKGETYWLLMPFKLRDEGVVLKHEGEEGDYDRIRVSFDPPGDEYVAYVNRETHLMDRWTFHLKSGAEGDYEWTEYYRYGGLRIATKRESEDEVIRFDDVYVSDSIPEELFTTLEPVEFP